jgi:2-polyprenyl-6-methoxyphenol hydroxylase-like FAD-dependent oxidoreductase
MLRLRGNRTEVWNMIGDHAVVIGASIAGLLAARALAEHYERVSVIDRDALPAAGEGRRAVPQGRHVHALLPCGRECMEELLPGLSDELVAAGATWCEPLTEMRFSVAGHVLARTPVGVRALLVGRPLLEGRIRDRVAALPNVELVDRCDVLGLVAAERGARVTGIRTISRADGSAEEVIGADLVVAASGRGGRVPSWFAGAGWERPAEERLETDLAYASRHLRLRDGALGLDKLVLIGARPDLPRSLALAHQEGDRWLLTLGGFGPGHRPPADRAGQLAFAATVAPPDVVAAIRAADVLDETATYRFAGSLRRRYERVERLPAGLLVVGDAVCSFNPIYAQGMTVAAIEAVALRRCLERGDRDLARRFFRTACPAIDHAWQMATGADLAMPWIDGPRPRRVRAINAYMARLLAVAEHDAVVARAFMHATAMLATPPSLLRPAIALRVLRARRSAAPPALSATTIATEVTR